MSIQDGQPVNAAASNAAFMSRTVNTSTAGKINVNNVTDSSSPSTGAVHTTGGLGVEKKAYIGNELHVVGETFVADLTATGDAEIAGTIHTPSSVVADVAVSTDILYTQTAQVALQLNAANADINFADITTAQIDDLTVNNSATIGQDLTVGGIFTVAGRTLHKVFGSRASPIAVTAAGGIAFSGSAYSNIIYVVGSGGAVIVTATPQISAGSFDGQRLIVIGTSDANSVQINGGTGVVSNGAVIFQNNVAAEYVWDTSSWIKIGGNQ